MSAQQILVYSDSLTWGIMPNTRQRLPFESRWPGVMEGALLNRGEPVRVIEDCLNGRRTAFEDPFKPGRNGLVGLEQRIEVNSPLKLVILMLGANDFQSMHSYNAWHSAQGMASLIEAVRRAPIEPPMPSPDILIVAPPPAQEAKGPIAPKFEGAQEKCAGLARAYQQVTQEHGCEFFDAGQVTTRSKVDGVHLDADQHRVLGIKYFEEVEPRDPGVRDYFRMYLLPGVTHCRGGAGPDAVDWLATLVGWVEQVTAPHRLVASKLDKNGKGTQ